MHVTLCIPYNPNVISPLGSQLSAKFFSFIHKIKLTFLMLTIASPETIATIATVVAFALSSELLL